MGLQENPSYLVSDFPKSYGSNVVPSATAGNTTLVRDPPHVHFSARRLMRAGGPDKWICSTLLKLLLSAFYTTTPDVSPLPQAPEQQHQLSLRPKKKTPKPKPQPKIATRGSQKRALPKKITRTRVLGCEVISQLDNKYPAIIRVLQNLKERKQSYQKKILESPEFLRDQLQEIVRLFSQPYATKKFASKKVDSKPQKQLSGDKGGTITKTIRDRLQGHISNYKRLHTELCNHQLFVDAMRLSGIEQSAGTISLESYWRESLTLKFGRGRAKISCDKCRLLVYYSELIHNFSRFAENPKEQILQFLKMDWLAQRSDKVLFTDHDEFWARWIDEN